MSKIFEVPVIGTVRVLSKVEVWADSMLEAAKIAKERLINEPEDEDIKDTSWCTVNGDRISSDEIVSDLEILIDDIKQSTNDIKIIPNKSIIEDIEPMARSFDYL